ncbi:hypothetical protein MRX96_058355 [Rhipicephalus microplus]
MHSKSPIARRNPCRSWHYAHSSSRLRFIEAAPVLQGADVAARVGRRRRRRRPSRRLVRGPFPFPAARPLAAREREKWGVVSEGATIFQGALKERTLCTSWGARIFASRLSTAAHLEASHRSRPYLPRVLFASLDKGDHVTLSCRQP